MCFVFTWEQTVTCATYSINGLVFITEMKSVYCVVRPGPLNKAVCAPSLNRPCSLLYFGVILWLARYTVQFLPQLHQQCITSRRQISCHTPNRLLNVGIKENGIKIVRKVKVNWLCPETRKADFIHAYYLSLAVSATTVRIFSVSHPQQMHEISLNGFSPCPSKGAILRCPWARGFSHN